MSEIILSVTALCSGYGHSAVLHGVDLTVERGEMVALIGANGAGKSTLMKTLVGLVRATSGSVFYQDGEITGSSPETLVRRGLALVPEGRMLFGPMSVRENLELGAYALGRERRKRTEPALARVHELFGVLAERAQQPASTLSGGEQQMLAIGRALMSSPEVLLLDEPSLGLAPKVIAEIFSALDALRAQGMTVVLVEQDARLALRHSDRAYVMRTGRIALSGRAHELLADQSLSGIYLGADPVGGQGSAPSAENGTSKAREGDRRGDLES